MATLNTRNRQTPHASFGIRTRSPSKQAVTDPPLRLHGHSDRQNQVIYVKWLYNLRCTDVFYGYCLLLLSPWKCERREASTNECMLSTHLCVYLNLRDKPVKAQPYVISNRKTGSTDCQSQLDLYSWRLKDQLDVTRYFISLLMCPTCFGH